MEKMKMQELKDKAWNAKNKEQWDAVMLAIKEAVEGDKYATEAIRKYCLSILPRKKEWWSKTENKKTFQPQQKLMFSKETDEAIKNLAIALTEYINKRK